MKSLAFYLSLAGMIGSALAVTLVFCGRVSVEADWFWWLVLLSIGCYIFSFFWVTQTWEISDYAGRGTGIQFIPFLHRPRLWVSLLFVLGSVGALPA